MIFEFIALSAVGLIVIGPKDLPKASRLAGRFTGKTLKTVLQLKQTLQQSSDSEVIQLKQDLEKGLGELSSIRGEIKRSINLRNTVFISNPLESPLNNINIQQQSVTSSSLEIKETSPLSQQPIQTSQPKQNTTLISSSLNPFAMVGQQHIQQQTIQTFDLEKAKQISQQVTKPNPYEIDPSFKPTIPSQYNTSPFGKVYYGPPTMEELYDDSSLLAKTERLNSGADLMSKAVLEQYYARHADKKEKEEEK